ncbi:hypothetical protein [Prevotellamassilia timonensis]|uniref:hypothetical protein n=1 Tax=Prevotellamassilia timonensis TaxID=1852370 RepID=UPI003079628B
MYDIQLNESGTRHLNVTEQNLQTIKKYGLFDGLVGSTGYITEAELDKLNIRSLIASMAENSKDLLDLCIDVIYHDKMKAYGLKNLIATYSQWTASASNVTEVE